MNNITFIDFHNHFDLLPSIVNKFTHRFLKNQNDIKFLLNHKRSQDQKIIINFALYAMPWLKNEYNTVSKQIDILEAYEKQYQGRVKVIRTKKDLESEFQIGILLHLESSRWFHNNIDILDKLYSRGVLGLIPVHYKNNWFGGSSDDPLSKLSLNKYQKKLSPNGIKLLKRMEELNMWLDVSHMNDSTLEMSLENFNGPIAASHIGARSVINVSRNLSDKSIELIKNKNGMIGLCAWSRITGSTQKTFKLTVDHFLSCGLEQQLMIGSDFGPPIHTFEENKSIFSFTDFIKNNYSDEVSKKILTQNALSFIKSFLK